MLSLLCGRHHYMRSRLLTVLLLGGGLLAQVPADRPTNRCQLVCNYCGKQSFSIPAKDGPRFTLVVQFEEYRWGLTGTHWYRGNPVVVEYNISCLRATYITYHKRQKTIEAWYGVVLEDGSGKQERFDAVLLKIDHGTLIPIKHLEGKVRTAF